jgi:hypothetical protein
MNSELLENTVRLEATEIDRHWQAQPQDTKFQLHLRLGQRSAGSLIAVRTIENDLRVTLDSSGTVQTIAVHRLPRSSDALILGCPVCTRWLKRLFLTAPKRHPACFAFVCHQCASEDRTKAGRREGATLPSHAARRPQHRRRRHHFVGHHR